MHAADDAAFLFVKATKCSYIKWQSGAKQRAWSSWKSYEINLKKRKTEFQ